MSKSTQRKQSAFAAGRLAAKEGKTTKDNPYKKQKNGLAKVWHAGIKDWQNTKE